MRINIIQCSVVFAILGCLYGCGGSKLVKEPAPITKQANPIAIVQDESMSVSLDWIIVKNSPESWAKNGDWDEYIISAQALSEKPVTITDIVVYDSLNFRLDHLNERSELKAGSRQTAKRYKKAKLDVTPGIGTAILASGATGAIIGATYLTMASVGGASTLTGVAASAAAGGAVLVISAPLFAVAGIVRGVNHHKVTVELQNIANVFPIAVSQAQPVVIHAFYPFAPSPDHVEIYYRDESGEHMMNMDTTQALAGFHMFAKEEVAQE